QVFGAVTLDGASERLTKVGVDGGQCLAGEPAGIGRTGLAGGLLARGPRRLLAGSGLGLGGDRRRPLLFGLAEGDEGVVVLGVGHAGLVIGAVALVDGDTPEDQRHHEDEADAGEGLAEAAVLPGLVGDA